MKNEDSKYCLGCGEEIFGRIDKKYCDQHCKSAYQYNQIKKDKTSLHHKITQQLRNNRKILKDHNMAGKATVRESELKKLGFNPRIFTHYWQTKDKKTYLFVYEYGFHKIVANKKTKYSLVKWQDYMNKQIGKL